MKALYCPQCAGLITPSVAPHETIVRCPSCGSESQQLAFEEKQADRHTSASEEEVGTAASWIPDIAHRVLLALCPEKDPRTRVLKWTFFCTWGVIVALVAQEAVEEIIWRNWGSGFFLLMVGVLAGPFGGIMMMIVARSILSVCLPSADVTAGEILEERRRKVQLAQPPDVQEKDSLPNPNASSSASEAIRKSRDDIQS